VSEWKEYKLGVLCQRVTSGGTPNTRKNEYYGGEIPWVRTQEVNFNRIYNTEIKITKKGLENSSAKWIPENSVIIAMYGATAGKVAINKIPITTNQACCNLIIDESKADYRFVYYNILSRFSSIANMAVGGAQQNLNAGMIKDLNISIPPLPTQTAIAEILSSLDDKIELNNKINQDLENLAQTLFKQWFIDFEFPDENGEPYKSSGGEMVESELGEIPKGWEVKRLETLAKISLGGTPSRNNGDYWNGNIPWVNSGAINENYILRPNELITQEGLENSSTKLIPKYSTLIAITGATLGQVSYSLIDACYNQSVISLSSLDNTREFIHLLVKTIIPELIKHQTGGAQQHINKGNVETFKVIFPSEELLKKFKDILTDLYLKIECNIKDNLNLTNLRDTLLPKLISGELEVNGLNHDSLDLHDKKDIAN
jgi:type I restriction enzyme S subunit